MLVPAAANAQSSFNTRSKNPEKGLFGKTIGKAGKTKAREPRSVHNAKRKQEKKEKRLKKEYAAAVERSRKRTYDIQSPEVQTRMKENQKNAALRDKEKKKNLKANTRKAGKKYS
jgi:hypothetical protein